MYFQSYRNSSQKIFVYTRKWWEVQGREERKREERIRDVKRKKRKHKCVIYLERMFYGSQLMIATRFKKGCRKIDYTIYNYYYYIIIFILYNYIIQLERVNQSLFALFNWMIDVFNFRNYLVHYRTSRKVMWKNLEYLCCNINKISLDRAFKVAEIFRIFNKF